MQLISLRAKAIAGLVLLGLVAGPGGAVTGQTDAARWVTIRGGATAGLEAIQKKTGVGR